MLFERHMRLLLLATLLLSSLSVSADQVLDLGSYFLSVKMRGTSVVYIHDVYDSNHVARFALMKTVVPVTRDGYRGEEYSYAFGVKNASGTVAWTSLDEELYKNLRTKIESAKQETAIASWIRGCRIRAIISDHLELVSLLSLCGDSPAEDSTGTIEADSNR